MSSDVGPEGRTTSTPFTRCGSVEETNSLPVSTVFDILADERRRHLLYYLIEETGGEAAATDVADHLCEVVTETGSVGSWTGSVERDSILVELHHRHIPKMEAAGLVEYEGRDGAVRYEEDPLVEDCLARVAARDFGQLP